MRTMARTNMELNRNKVLLGLSGGVDSATAALLLKEKGFEVTGYYFDVLGNNTAGRDEAAAVAKQLGIDVIYEDVSADFKKIVIANFIDEYLHGRTPNPCVICNPNIKFKKLIAHADEIGAYYIATGHYCRIFCDEESGKFYLRHAASDGKDQSYMLYRLGQEVLSRLIFPLGEFETKDETRELARENSLQNADKKDSQEICFIASDDNYVDYIKREGFDSEPGDFIDKNGKLLGRHKGILNYTLGQRKGLGIALGKPAFVTHMDPERNRIMLGDNEELFSTTVISQNNFFTEFSVEGGDAAKGDKNFEKFDGKTVLAKVRYAAAPAEAMLKIDGKRIIAEFKQPQRAATAGQSIVFYDGDCVIGGGFITDAMLSND